MKLPRDLSGEALAKALERLGYTVDRQTGSHIRLTTQENRPLAKVDFRPPAPQDWGENVFKVPQNWGI
jgi:predicted RNA binding protein YcfA (HicA-like mRNA interferase family)